MHAPARHRRFAAPLIAAILALSPVGRADAGYIASDLGAGDSFGTGSFNLTGAQSTTGVGYGLAVEFAISGAEPVAFGSARLALAFHDGDNAVDVLLMADGGGAPGSTMESIHVAGIPVGPSLVVATSTARTLLQPSAHYWLAAVATKDAYLSWMVNGSGQSGHLAYRLDTGSGPGAWLTSPGNPDPAFAIASAVAVPSPPSLALLGAGMLAIAGAGARRRFRARRA